MNEDAGSMKRIFKNGAGAVVTKSIGIKANKGHPNPTIVELEHGFINAMGLPNPGIKDFKPEIKELKKNKIPVIGSIYGKNIDEFKFLSEKMQEYGADAVELNMSCPNVQGYGLEIGSDIDLVKKIIREIKKSTKIPIFVKLSPNVVNIVDIAKAAEKEGADAIVAINTVKAMKIDLDLKIPVLSNKIGGYSGPAIRPIGVRCVYEISKNIKIPVIGVGGINTGKDVVEYLMAGATAVEIGSAIYYRGIDAFNKIIMELEEWMIKNKIKKIDEIIGVSQR